MGQIGLRFVPLAYLISTGKTEGIYTEMIQSLGIFEHLNEILLDFEQAPINAWKQTYPLVSVGLILILSI